MKIKWLFLTAVFFALASVNFAQSSNEAVKRLATETAQQFAERNAPPESETVHTVETEAWGVKKTVMAFYKVSGKTADGTAITQVDGYLFMPESADTYRKILIYNFEEEGDTPKIEAVFFANADKDKTQELVVITSYQVSHYDVSGKLSSTYIFDDVRPGTSPAKLNYLEAISEKVSGGCDCTYRDGKTKGTKKFQTAAQVRAGLKKHKL